MFRALPPAPTGLKMVLNTREVQQTDIAVRDAPTVLRMDRRLEEAVRRASSIEFDAIELRAEGSGARARVHFDGTNGLTVRRID